MINSLENLLKAEKISYESIADLDYVLFTIPYMNGFGKNGTIDIFIFEDDNNYYLNTTNEISGKELKNDKKVKSIKAVHNFIKKYL